MPKIKKISYILAIVLSVLYLLWRFFLQFRGTPTSLH